MNASAKSIGTREHEELHREVHLEVPAAILAVVFLQTAVAFLSLDNGWTLWTLPWWTWLLPVTVELALLFLFVKGPLPIHGRRRIAIVLAVVMSLVNAVTLTLLLGSIASAHERSGGQLLIKAATVWVTNVVAWGIAFWELDAGGPVERRGSPGRRRDFDFPTRGERGWEGWQPHLVDYLYVSFTNSLVFSPTDAMPLSRGMKMAMVGQSSVSAISVLLVISRAVGLF
jgi:hypothetical protein